MDERSCTVSVIVPTRNRAAVLRENIDSVLAQETDDFEVIYANDDSSDETAALLASYGNRLRIVDGTWHAPGPARNAAAHMARGRFLLFTDDDCTVPRDWISGMLARYEAHGCDVLSGGFSPYSLDTNASRYLHHRMRLLFADTPKPIKAAPMMNFLIPRALFDRADGFSGKPWSALEDWEFCHRLLQSGAMLFYDPAVKVTHRYQTDWEPAMQRLRTTAALAIDVYRASGMSVADLMFCSTLRCLTAPAWSLFRFPLNLYPTSLCVEWKTYFERIRTWLHQNRQV